MVACDRTHLHGVWETLHGIAPQQQLLKVLTERDLGGQVCDVRLLCVEVLEALQFADVRHQGVDSVATDVEHA